MPKRRAFFRPVREFNYGSEERGEFGVACAHRNAGGAIGIERPEKEREKRGPCSSAEKKQATEQGLMPVSCGRADSANEDDLDQQAGSGERWSQNGKIAPEKTEKDGDGQRPDQASAGD